MALRVTQELHYAAKAPGPVRAKMIKLQKLFQKLPQFNIVDEANGLYLHMSGMSWEPRKSHYLWRGPEQLAQNMMAKLQHPTAIMVPVGSTVDVVGGPEPE